MKRNHELGEDESNNPQEGKEVRMELKYCERCGGLWLRPAGAGVVYCQSCQRIVAELPVPKKKPQRVNLPVRRTPLVDEYSIQNGNQFENESDGLDFEAAGGAA